MPLCEPTAVAPTSVNLGILLITYDGHREGTLPMATEAAEEAPAPPTVEECHGCLVPAIRVMAVALLIGHMVSFAIHSVMLLHFLGNMLLARGAPAQHIGASMSTPSHAIVRPGLQCGHTQVPGRDSTLQADEERREEQAQISAQPARVPLHTWASAPAELPAKSGNCRTRLLRRVQVAMASTST